VAKFLDDVPFRSPRTGTFLFLQQLHREYKTVDSTEDQDAQITDDFHIHNKAILNKANVAIFSVSEDLQQTSIHSE
jgi:hypothetical protein